MTTEHESPDRDERETDAVDIGFIVHPTWRVVSGVAEIHLYGRLHSGETFQIIDTRVRPGFYLRASDVSGSRSIVTHEGGVIGHSAYRTMDGEETVAVLAAAPGKLGALRRALSESDIRTYEGDVPFAWAYLIDRHLRGSVEVHGPWEKGDRVERVYRNPDLVPCDVEPQLVVASLALELDPKTGTIRASALAGSGPESQHDVDACFALAGHASVANTTILPSERELLEALLRALRELDPDLITGWDVVSAVLAPLKERMAQCRIPFNLGRSGRLSRLTTHSSPKRGRGRPQAIIEGRQILDARGIARAGLRRFDDLDLAAVSRNVLGHAPASISEKARGVLDILEDDNLIRLTVRRSMLIGIPLQRAWTSVQAFDFLYLSELHARGQVAPTRDVDRLGGAPAPGGLILSPHAGAARNVLVLDFKSLYPSVVRTFNIDPATQIADPEDRQDVILAPNGAAFARTPGILPQVLNRFFESRARANERGDEVASYAYKIIMNSFYGVLGTSGCRFASQSLSGAITSFGQYILRWTRDLLQERGLTVLYGDTDSLFVDAGLPEDVEPGTAMERGQQIALLVNKELADYVTSNYAVESRLELEMEKVYSRFFLPTVRGEERGRAKGYAGLVVGPDGGRVEVVGMEAVRRDWTALARRFQRELLDLAFHDASTEAVETYGAEILGQLRAGGLDEELVYQKSLRKPLADYTKARPPHVQAATLLPEAKKPGDVIRYVITVRGPQPIGYVSADLDYAHIARKQLLPIARTLAPLMEIPESLFGSGQIELF